MNPTAPTTSGQALSNLQGFQSSVQTPGQELQSAQQGLGVQGAQQQVQGLQGAINNTTNLLNQVAPSVEGRTQNSLVTSAQAGKQIENEQAPIQADLSKDTQDYNTANSNYTNLEGQAENLANSNEQAQSNQLSYLQNIYNDLYTQEQNTAQSQSQQSQFSQSLAEQAREADLSAGSSSGVGGTLASILGGASSPGGAQVQQRSGGGFNFQDANGQAINAAAYANAKGVPIRTLLQDMANEGDTGAKTALNYVGNDYGVNQQKLKTLEVAPATYNATTSLLKSLGFNV